MNHLKYSVAMLMLIGSQPLLSLGNLRETIKTEPSAASVLYHVYEGDKAPAQTPAPKGYKPVYISHYGRHGSRWLQSNAEYRVVTDPFEAAEKRGTLTPKGKALYAKVKRAYEDGIGVEGSLSPIGSAQHQGIAKRMAANFPEVFKGKPQIDARATTSVRCVTSMNAFCVSLLKSVPTADITFEASNRTADLLNVHSLAPDLFPEYPVFLKKGDYVKRVDEIIRDKAGASEFVASILGPGAFQSSEQECKFMLYLFWLASDQQDVLPDNEFWEFFTEEQLYWLAVAENYRVYVRRASHAATAKWNKALASMLLSDILERCDSAMSGNQRAADLRFGHDSTIMALAPLMGLNDTDFESDSPEEIMEKWDIRHITPMAANIQIILYSPQKKGGDILAKILLNEKEATLPLEAVSGPYYRWTDVRNHFASRINQYK